MKKLTTFFVLISILLFHSFVIADYNSLKTAVNATVATKEYSLVKNETVTDNLGQLGGTQLTIFGNGYDIDGNKHSGISFGSEGQNKILNIKNVGEIKNFNSYVFSLLYSGKELNIFSSIFKNNFCPIEYCIGITTIYGGTKFINNSTDSSAGAIFNAGVINLIADIDNIEFTGNKANGISNAIYNTTKSTINLWASDSANIIFNDRITSENNSSLLNINQSSGTLPTNGKVILNEDMRGYTGQVNLYGGEIELQAKTEEGSNVNTNKFFSGDINLSRGILNIQNSAIDNITVSTWTSTANANLKFDVDLSNNTSDNFTVENTASGVLNLTAINILGVDEDSGQIILFNNEKSPILNIQTNASYGGYEYTFTNSTVEGVLNYIIGEETNLKKEINNTTYEFRSYSLEKNEIVTDDLGQLGGEQLTIFGNGYEVNGSSKAGITVRSGQTLNIEKGTGENFVWKNFKRIGSGVIYNKGGTIIINSIVFDSNIASNRTYPLYLATSGHGGAIDNNEGIAIIKSTIFNENNASSGGAIFNGGTVTIEDSNFINNVASDGAIFNKGTVTLIANKQNVLFTGNTIAITNNDGIINLETNKNMGIIFNDRITSNDNNNIININGTLPTTGKVILNEDMSGYTGRVNLYGGEIELQAKTEEGSNVNTNKFFSGDINLSRGILNIQNSAIDNITVSTWTSTANSNLKFDVDLNNNTSDNFTVENSVSGVLNLTAINILGVNEKIGQITLFNNEISPKLNILTIANYDGYEYTFTTGTIAGVLNYERADTRQTLKEVINIQTPLIRSYSLAKNEMITLNLENLGGEQLTIFGNGYKIDGNNKNGIKISNKQTLNIDKGIGENFVWEKFDIYCVGSGTSDGYGYGGVIYNNGTSFINSVTFASNKARGYSPGSKYSGEGYGGAIYNSGICSINSTEFNLNEANGSGVAGYAYGGAIYNKNGEITINSSVFSSNKAYGSGSGLGRGYGGAIYNVGGKIIISSSLFSLNKAYSNNSYGYGGAIGNSGEITINSSVFSLNEADTRGGAINNSGILNLIANTNNVEFTGNKANGVSNAIHDNGGVINLWASDNADIIFNDRITSYDNSSSILNINQSSGTLPTTGKIVLNEDMS